MMNWVRNIFKQFLTHEQCVGTFTLSACMGIFIAFSPFVGFHTAMAFLFSWLFALNFSVVFGVSILINNPWTMAPVYGLSYLTGDWLLSWFGVNHYAWNPSWVLKGNEFLAQYVSFAGFSFWAFMIGGNLLGGLLALIAYPLVRMGAHMAMQGKERVVKTVMRSKAAVRSVTTKVQDSAIQMRTQRKEHAAGDTK